MRWGDFASSAHCKMRVDPVSLASMPELLETQKVLPARNKSLVSRQSQKAMSSPTSHQPSPWPPLRKGGKKQGGLPVFFPPLTKGGSGGVYSDRPGGVLD